MKTIRNEADRANLIERLNKLNGNEERLWGKMTVNQMMSHLVQAGEMVFGHDVPIRSNLFFNKIAKPLLLYVLPIPKDVKTSPNVDQQQNGRKPHEFAEDKQNLLGLLNKLGTMPLDLQCAKHPVFGKMNAKEWGILAYKHTDHHLKQFGV